MDINSQVVEVLPSIMDYYDSMQLVAGILHVNNVPFLTFILNHIHYEIATTIDNMKTPTLEAGLKSIMQSYAIRGFSIGIIFLNIQFKYTKDKNNFNTVNLLSHSKYTKLI